METIKYANAKDNIYIYITQGNYGGEKKGGLGVAIIRPKEFLEYSCNCCMKPKFGFAILLLLLMYSIACIGGQPWLAIKYAATTLTLRLTPSPQCTSTRASELEDSAFHIHDVVLGR